MIAKQISITPNSTSGWMASTFNIYGQPDSSGFPPVPVAIPVASLTNSNLTNAITAVGYLIEDAIANGYVAQALTITQLSNYIETILIQPPVTQNTSNTLVTVNTNTVYTPIIGDIITTDTPVMTNTVSIIYSTLISPTSSTPIIVVANPITTTDTDGNITTITVTTTTITTTTPIIPSPYYSDTVDRTQYSIQIAKVRNTDGAVGSSTISTEQLPTLIRDAWISILSTF